MTPHRPTAPWPHFARTDLGRDHDGVHALRRDEATALLVLDGDLGLAVGAEQREHAVLADDGELVAEAGRERVRERHQLGGLVGRVAEHVALVARADLLRLLAAARDGRVDLARLRVDVVDEAARLVVEALLRRVEADLLDRVAHDRLVVELRVGGDLAEDHDEVGARARLARDVRLRVTRKARIDDRVRDLVGELVGVALVHRLGGEEKDLRLLLRAAERLLDRRDLRADLRQLREQRAG